LLKELIHTFSIAVIFKALNFSAPVIPQGKEEC